jgi:hypothetical protein
MQVLSGRCGEGAGNCWSFAALIIKISKQAGEKILGIAVFGHSMGSISNLGVAPWE